MGNTQPSSMLNRPSAALDSFVAELGAEIVYEKSLGSARFLKTVKCRHKNGPLVVKIFIKPDPGISLRSYHRRLKFIRDALLDIPNIYGFQSFIETEKAGYLIRQWVASNLYDRISTRPFLTPIEKKWIAFQLITALRDARNRKVSHGDIKSENILVTSWNWVYLSDFATYKPTYLPLDDPSEFSYFFDTSGRRTCYIAPERFYTAAENPEISAKKSKLAMDDTDGKPDGKITEAMDCFSVGCVIAELFLENAPLFTLSQLFKYREGEYNMDQQLSVIEDEGVRNMIKQMISLEPTTRPTFDTLLHTSRGAVFPESFFSFLHNYVASLNEPASSFPSSTPTPVAAPMANQGSGPPSIRDGPELGALENLAATLPSDSDHRMERLWGDYDSIEPYLVPEISEEPIQYTGSDNGQSFRNFQDILPVELYIPNRETRLPRPQYIKEDGASLIILSLVTANIRNCTVPSPKTRALDVLLSLAACLTDEAKLDRMVPYIVDLLHDEVALVRSAAFRTLIQVLMMVTVITPSNATIFPEYIFPNIKYLVDDPEVSVRCTYAQCIVQVAETAERYLEMAQALKAHGTFKLATDTQEIDAASLEVSYDTSKQYLKETIQQHLSALLMDQSSVVKRAVLHNISYLCVFLGVQKTNDVLLSHMITYLNDRDWVLRSAFFESIVDVATCARGKSLEEYILPLMIQALSDVEENVIARVLEALTRLCQLNMFQKLKVWELMGATLCFLHHPNVWIRDGAAAFISAAASHLPASDVWCILYPSLRHHLGSDIINIEQNSLLVALKSPVSRQIFEAAVQWAMKTDNGNFWKTNRRLKSENPRDSVTSLRKSPSKAASKLEEDELQLSKLRQLGMTSSDEMKLNGMKEFLVKLANAISSFATRSMLEPESERLLRTTVDVELPKLGVVPQTVFLKRLDTRSARTPTHKISMEFSGKGLPSPRATRLQSADSGSSGTPFEDLRRRLATINASNSSLAITNVSRDLRALSSPVTTAFNGSSIPPSPGETGRPSSPTESIVSGTNSSTFRPLSRMQIGTTDGQKAAPAVGSSRTNVAGFLDSHPKIQSEDSSERSGRTSPTMMSQTIRTAGYRQQSLPISSYDGQEPGISNLLEKLYLDNNRDSQNDFGPKIREGPVRRRNPVRHSFASREEANRRLDATLIAHLNSHSDCITGLAVSPDHMFFVSSSDDHTVKVWDTARLERNVTSKPRHTYGQHHAPVKCVCMIEGSHCFASAADDGSLHVVRVHTSQTGTLPKYGKLQVIREHRVDGGPGEYITSILHYNTDSTSNLIYVTNRSRIAVLDVRSMHTLQSMQNPLHHGAITCICVDKKRTWILVGTATGVLTLWDKRFGLRLKSWHVGIASSGRSVRIHQCTLHPTKGRGKWVMVTVECTRTEESGITNLIEVWDIERSVLVETFCVRSSASQDTAPEPHEVTGVDADNTPAAAIAALVRLRQGDNKLLTTTASPSLNVRAMVVGMDFGGSSGHRTDVIEHDMEGHARRGGFILCGSEDRKIRLWDLTRPERSMVLSGIAYDEERPTYSRLVNGTAATYLETWPASSHTTQTNRAPHRISLITHHQNQLLRSHQDVITSLVCVDSPFRGGVISGDRAGILKVWRVEAVDQ